MKSVVTLRQLNKFGWILGSQPVKSSKPAQPAAESRSGKGEEKRVEADRDWRANKGSGSGAAQAQPHDWEMPPPRSARGRGHETDRHGSLRPAKLLCCVLRSHPFFSSFIQSPSSRVWVLVLICRMVCRRTLAMGNKDDSSEWDGQDEAPQKGADSKEPQVSAVERQRREFEEERLRMQASVGLPCRMCSSLGV